LTRPVAGGFAVLAVAAATASAQPTPVFRAGLDLVNVTVTVRDGKGGLVPDLTAEDFVVREDGRLQPLDIFAPAARPEEREELALNLGMLFDTSESMRKDLKLSQQSAVRFLEAIPRALGQDVAAAAGSLGANVVEVVLGITLMGATLDGQRLDTNEWYFPLKLCQGCLAGPTTCPSGKTLTTGCGGLGQDQPPFCK